MKPPAFQFYVDDFIGGTVALTTVEVGAYIRLLCYQWGTGAIPSDQESLTLIAGAIVSGKVIAKFPNGKNRRLEMERRKQKEYRDKQRLKGIASGVSRSNRGSTVVQPKANRGSTKPEPSVVGSRFEPEGNSPSPVSSLQSPKDVGAVAPQLSDADWMASLKLVVAYAGIDIESEFSKMATWCGANSKKPSRRRFVNWLNRCEKPMAHNGSSARNGADKVVLGREYERVIERMKVLKQTYSDSQTWNNEDLVEFRKMKLRRDELKPILGITI